MDCYPHTEAKYIFSLLLLCLVGMLTAQNDSKYLVNQKIKAQATSLVNNNLPNLIDKPNPELDLDFLSFAGFLNAKNFTTEHFENLLYATKLQLAKKDNSINLYTSFHQNNYALNSEDNEDRSRFNAGVDLELLRNGFAERKKRIAKLKGEMRVDQMLAPSEAKDKNYAYRYNCLIYAFNQEKIGLLEERIVFLDAYVKMMYELYFAHELAYSKIIEQKGRLEEVQIILESTLHYNAALENELGLENIIPLNTTNLPLANIDIDQLLAEDGLDFFQDSLKQLMGKQIELKYDQNLRSRLRTYARYNYGNFGTEINSPNFLSFGVRFNTPINFGKNATNEAVEYEKILLDKSFANEKYNNIKELINYYSEYQYKVKQYNNFIHKLFKIQEELRVEKVLMENQRSVHSPMSSIKLIDNYRAVKYELIELKQQMYTLVLKMHRKSFQEEFTQCMVPIDFDEKNKKLTGNRFYLLDPKIHSLSEQDFLVKYLKKNEINHVLLPENMVNVKSIIPVFKEEEISIYVPERNYHAGLVDKELSIDGIYNQSIKKDQTWIKMLKANKEQSYNQYRLTHVPFYIFKNRNELEQWIQIENQSIGTVMFLFDDINKLKKLDTEFLGMK